MQIDFEILMIFNVAILFTVISILSSKDRNKALFSLVTAITWLVLGLGYVGAAPTFPVYALLFLALGIIFTVRAIIISADMMGKRPKTWR